VCASDRGWHSLGSDVRLEIGRVRLNDLVVIISMVQEQNSSVITYLTPLSQSIASQKGLFLLVIVPIVNKQCQSSHFRLMSPAALPLVASSLR
jgi:hypothetical protein